MKSRKLCITIAVIMLMTVFSVPSLVAADTKAAAKTQLEEKKQDARLKKAIKQTAHETKGKAAKTAAARKYSVEGGYIYISNGYVIDADHTVTGITAEDFKGANVTGIDDFAFAYCSDLKSVEIGAKITDIGVGAFAYCSALEEFKVHEYNDDFVVGDGVLYSFDNYGLTLLQYPAGKAETSFSVPEIVTDREGVECDVVEIEEYAFAGNLHLEEASVNAYIERIGPAAFANMIALKKIEVAGDNEYYFVGDDGALYTISGKTLLQYPAGREGNAAFEIPNTVKTIGEAAFEGTMEIESMKIPSSVTKINDFAFFEMYGLEKFIVVSANKNYCAQSSVLFTKSKKTLISYPTSKLNAYYEVPYTTTNIEDNAIFGFYLKVIDIPSKVKSLGSFAVDSAEKLSLVGNSRVKSYVARHKSSSEGGMTYVARPGAVSKLKAKTSKKKVKLTWKKGSNASGYEIYRSSNSGKSWKKVKTITKGSTVSYTNTGLKKGKRYYYIVDTYRTVKGYKVYCTEPKVIAVKGK